MAVTMISAVPMVVDGLLVVAHEDHYQTPLDVCEYMAGLILPSCRTVLEPTPGEGRLVSAIRRRGFTVIAPERFEDINPFDHFDATCMNPPFIKSIENQFLLAAMEMSDQVIALLPWFSLVNSDSRTRKIVEYGLRSVTHLPRKTFPKIRVQPCILNMERGYRGPTTLEFYGCAPIDTNLE